MIDHKESMAKMREFANEHLVECCAELLHWHKESILPDGKVRELAALCTFDEYNRLTQAERMIELAALERVARGPHHETEGVFATDGSGPFDCYACGKKVAHPSACELGAAACSWRKQDEYGDHVSTGCGHEFVLNDAGDFKDGEPVFPFCCYCAKPTVFRQWQDEPECVCDNGDGPECFACSDRRARAALQHRGDSRGGEGS